MKVAQVCWVLTVEHQGDQETLLQSVGVQRLGMGLGWRCWTEDRKGSDLAVAGVDLVDHRLVHQQSFCLPHYQECRAQDKGHLVREEMVPVGGFLCGHPPYYLHPSHPPYHPSY